MIGLMILCWTSSVSTHGQPGFLHGDVNAKFAENFDENNSRGQHVSISSSARPVQYTSLQRA